MRAGEDVVVGTGQVRAGEREVPRGSGEERDRRKRWWMRE